MHTAAAAKRVDLPRRSAVSTSDDLPLKTTSYYLGDNGGLMLSKRGSLWSISVDTTDGVIEFEMTTKDACAAREFLKDAVCAECAATQETDRT